MRLPIKGRAFNSADGMLLACVLIWSANVSFVKILLRYWAPFSLASVRMALALVGFAVIVAVRERTVAVQPRDAPLLAGAALFGIFLNQAGFVFALRFSHASSVALLLAMIPVFVALLSATFRIEPFTRWSLLGLPISLLGVFLVVVAEPGSTMSIGSVEGNGFGLATALSWAAYTILLQSLLKRYSVARISFWVVAIGLAGLLGPGLTSADAATILREPWWAWVLVAYSAVVAIITTNFLWYLGTHRLGPARGSLYAFLQPFLGVLFAIVILGDPARPGEIFGGVLIVAGIMAARRGKLVTPPADPRLVASVDPASPG